MGTRGISLINPKFNNDINDGNDKKGSKWVTARPDRIGLKL
jgi:hypothetical protein